MLKQTKINKRRRQEGMPGRRRGGERRIKREPNRVYMHACESLSTDSALGTSRWVTETLEITAELQRRMHPSAGMPRTATPTAARNH